MNKQEFLEELKIAINKDDELKENMVLNDLAEWDSLSKMCTITLFADKLNIPITIEELKDFETVDDLIKKAGF